MKKKVVTNKASAKKTVKRTAAHSHSRASSPEQSILFRRIVIISACLVLFVGVLATFNKGATRQAVEGMSIMAGLYDQATVQLPSTPDAKSFNIYYGPNGQYPFTNAVRNIQPTITSYTISDLKRGVTYQYYYVYVNAKGKEVLPSQEASNGHILLQTFSNVQPM